MKTISLCNFETCTSCASCLQICPVNAISFTQNKIGLRKPIINNEKCIACGKCEKSCPQKNETYKAMQKSIKPITFLAYNKNLEAVNNSASGALFYSIAQYVIQSNGVVFGASYNETFDKVHIIKACTMKELEPLTGSKYVESFTDSSFIEVQKELAKGTLVYYAALPCQIAGLLNFLQKPYNNLITSDIVCHGTCPNRYFELYIKNLKEKLPGHFTYFTQTSKKLGWSILIQKAVTTTTTTTTWDADSYLRLFLDGLFFKPTCYKCSFAKLPRLSDITLGDFFGFGVLKSNRKIKIPHNGISMIMVNTQNGKNIISNIKNNVYLLERPIQEAIYFNHNLWRASKKHKLYNSFYNDSFIFENWSEFEKKYYLSFKRTINRKLRLIIKKILGAKLVAYCMYTVYKHTGLLKKADKIIQNNEY